MLNLTCSSIGIGSLYPLRCQYNHQKYCDLVFYGSHHLILSMYLFSFTVGCVWTCEAQCKTISFDNFNEEIRMIVQVTAWILQVFTRFWIYHYHVLKSKQKMLFDILCSPYGRDTSYASYLCMKLKTQDLQLVSETNLVLISLWFIFK